MRLLDSISTTSSISPKKEKACSLGTGYPVDNAVNFGIVALQVKSEDRARALMGNGPAVWNRVMNVELHPFGVAITWS